MLCKENKLSPCREDKANLNDLCVLSLTVTITQVSLCREDYCYPLFLNTLDSCGQDWQISLPPRLWMQEKCDCSDHISSECNPSGVLIYEPLLQRLCTSKLPEAATHLLLLWVVGKHEGGREVWTAGDLWWACTHYIVQQNMIKCLCCHGAFGWIRDWLHFAYKKFGFTHNQWYFRNIALHRQQDKKRQTKINSIICSLETLMEVVSYLDYVLSGPFWIGCSLPEYWYKGVDSVQSKPKHAMK